MLSFNEFFISTKTALWILPAGGDAINSQKAYVQSQFSDTPQDLR